MPLYQEPTFHDTQEKNDEISQFTNSTTYEDITGATLTTKDLAQPSTYKLWLSVMVSGSANNTTSCFQVLADATPIMVDRAVFLKIKDSDEEFTILAVLEDVPAGSVLQVQWKTNIGTLTLSEYNMMIDGIPKSRVVE